MLEVAPLIGTPPTYHWYVGVGFPLAAALKETDAPVVTDWLDGWVVKEGALVAAFTVSVAALEVTLPALLVATTV